MPRDLSDVLHYFLPELDESAPAQGTAQALPILALPIGDRDVVRTALAWNLAIETTRLGGSSVILAPESENDSALWPEAGVGPLGSELVFAPARDLAELWAVAEDLAAARAEKARQGGIVFVRLPPAWLIDPEMTRCGVPWVLLFSSANRRDLGEAFEYVRMLAAAHPSIQLGLTIQGANRISEARSAFETLAARVASELGRELTSYGLLVDDLNVYRAIAAQRPIGLAHPQAPATRALTDVARLLYEDARSGSDV